jgi:two-component system, OmpR family, sensor histidine kinase KdpD
MWSLEVAMMKLLRPRADGGQDRRAALKRTLVGTGAALATMAVLTVAMLPLRGSLSIATTALILIVPVVIGVVVGGFPAGVLSVVAGFLVYDFFFIPPYQTLWVGAPQNWVAAGVYVVVMLPVARVVAGMNAARARERRQGMEIRQLFELSDLLVEDKPLDVLLSVIVTTLADVFGSRQVAIFLPDPAGHLAIAASAGEPLGPEQLRRVLPGRGSPASLDAHTLTDGDLLVLALTAAGRPVGLLVLSGEAAARHEREPLLLFANQVALAVERVQLREQALRTRLTEEMARLAKTLVAAVAHDLRSPLASIKASSSTLADPDLDITPEARHSLATLIDVQADRLADLVQNLLDMSRIQAGVLQPRRTVTAPGDLVAKTVGDVTPALRGHPVDVDVPADLPPVDVDLVLISRVLANLLENAVRYSPKNRPITIRGTAGQDGTIKISVTDHGPGVAPDRRDEIFGLLARREGDVGAGLGLTIAKTFVEAHGQRIWVEDAPGGGARFCFTLPVAASIPEEPQLAARPHH